MSVLPPPAATVARVLPAARFTSAASSTTVHLLIAGEVTRCGHRTAAGWQLYAGPPPEPADVPPARLCPRCLAGLPATTRQALDPTPAELRAVHEQRARAAATDLVNVLAELRQEALVDGSAWERTHLVHARQVPALAQPRGRGTTPLTRAERATHIGGYIAHEWPMTLLELLNHVDPSSPDTPGWRVWFLDAPEPGTAVDVGGTYDGRAYDWRRKGHAR